MALLMIVVLLVNGLLLLVDHPALLLRVPIVGLTAGMSNGGAVFDLGLHLCQGAGEAEVRCLL